MFTLENFTVGIRNATRILAEQTDVSLRLKRVYRHLDDTEVETKVIGEIPLSDINNMISSLGSEYTFTDSFLWNNSTFEAAVLQHNRMMPIRLDRDMYDFFEHNYKYTISKASTKYLFALICFSAATPTFEIDMGLLRLSQSAPITSIESFFEQLRLFTAKISYDKGHSIAEFKRRLHSYLFNISYNRDAVFSIIDFSESSRALRTRARRDGQLFPYKTYKPELTRYYHQAIAVDIPFTQYLAFFHVAEFFFHTIVESDAFQEIENYITRPSFSPYKKENIKQFYEMIKKKMREQREDGVWSEKVGLLLCLKKYIPDINSLKNSIETIDSTAINFYKTSLVEFAGESQKINFDSDVDIIYACIRDRVYAVRNAIVHSKEGDKLHYEPFKHDKQLAKEIPLIRCIAEEIIVNSAKSIEYNFED